MCSQERALQGKRVALSPTCPSSNEQERILNVTIKVIRVAEGPRPFPKLITGKRGVSPWDALSPDVLFELVPRGSDRPANVHRDKTASLWSAELHFPGCGAGKGQGKRWFGQQADEPLHLTPTTASLTPKVCLARMTTVSIRSGHGSRIEPHLRYGHGSGPQDFTWSWQMSR